MLDYLSADVKEDHALTVVNKTAYSDGERAKVNCYGADDVREGVAIMWHEGVGVSITGNSTNPTRFQHPVAGTYKKEMTEAGKKYFSVASGGGTGRTLHPDNMAAGPASYGMTDTLGRMHSDAQFAGSSSVPAHVEWMVLDRRGDRVLLLSCYGLDAQPYHQTSTAVNWSNSDIRRWLQNEFYNEAFTAEEQTMIATTQNATPINSNNAGSPGPNTYDKVFLLSSTEATNYLPSPESRMVKATSYALMRGAGTNYSQNSFWWVRSYADGSRRKVLMVNSQGNVYASYMNDYEAVVRPAIWIEVE